MPGFPSPFGSDDGLFDPYDEFVAETVPEPDAFLEGHDVLEGTDHVAFHRLTRELFEERTVYDMTFNYNLARLNLDTRHANAGYRYAEERGESLDALDVAAEDVAVGDESVAVGGEDAAVDREDAASAVDGEDLSVLRAEFTPTTPFCPQTHTLTIGSFRAWNGLADRHEYDLVRVRAAPMHHQSQQINEQLAELEETYLRTGDPTAEPEDAAEVGSNPMERTMEEDGPSRGPGRAPF